MILFLIVSSVSAYSQVLEGRILDKTTQESLPGATVYLDGSTTSTITDQEGNFSLNTKNSNNTLVVSLWDSCSSRNLKKQSRN